MMHRPNRAQSAEAAITTRHLGQLWHLPGTQLGAVAWPPAQKNQHWHYWWQAHLLDCLIDAQLRDPQPERLNRIKRQIRSHWLRNVGRWTNDYYDDMAWLALALERADRLLGIKQPRAIRTLSGQLLNAPMSENGGAIPWRKQDLFFNTPANGPAGIFMTRTGHLRRALEIADWIDRTLIDPETHLVFDGIQCDGQMERAQYTYCQGVVLGLETELAVRISGDRHQRRVYRLVEAVQAHMTTDGVISGGGGGDGGLFNGILTRNLALVANELPGNSPRDVMARRIARNIVLTSAQSAWSYRQAVDGLPLFGSDWSKPATMPVAAGRSATFAQGTVVGSEVPERDLSVQLSGWMLLEAAHMLGAIH
jgi:predicted alpha-1,6-mannanase (GH76 family)